MSRLARIARISRSVRAADKASKVRANSAPQTVCNDRAEDAEKKTAKK